jgi:hypothetical protein
MVYRDGSWYAPGVDGGGDYYTGVERSHSGAYDWPWAWSVGFTPYGGYCPPQYRYCTSFWADPWYGYGFYRPYVLAWQPWHGHRRSGHTPESDSGSDPDAPVADRGGRAPREPRQRPAPRVREPGTDWGGRRPESPRPRRRTAEAGSGSD